MPDWRDIAALCEAELNELEEQRGEGAGHKFHGNQHGGSGHAGTGTAPAKPQTPKQKTQAAINGNATLNKAGFKNGKLRKNGHEVSVLIRPSGDLGVYHKLPSGQMKGNGLYFHKQNLGAAAKAAVKEAATIPSTKDHDEHETRGEEDEVGTNEQVVNERRASAPSEGTADAEADPDLIGYVDRVGWHRRGRVAEQEPEAVEEEPEPEPEPQPEEVEVEDAPDDGELRHETHSLLEGVALEWRTVELDEVHVLEPEVRVTPTQMQDIYSQVEDIMSACEDVLSALDEMMGNTAASGNGDNTS